MKRRGMKNALLVTLVLFMFMAFGLQVSSMAEPAGVIKIGEKSYSTLEDAVDAAEEGDTLILSGGDMTVDQMVTIPAKKKLTLDLGGNKLISRVVSSFETPRMLKVSNKKDEAVGSFTLKNGTITAEDSSGDNTTAGAIYSYGADLTIDGVEAHGFNADRRGSVVQVEGSQSDIKVNIKECNFHDNSSRESGGAISLSGTSKDSEVQIVNNTIKNNKVTSTNYSFGGGIAITGFGSYTISGNNIEKNEASVTNDVYGGGIYWSHGGGISIESSLNDRNNDNAMHLVLENNTISENKAQLFGGGIYLNMNKEGGGVKVGDTIDLKSGKFINNHSGYAGGAIDFSVHEQPTLVLTNALFTENKARSGGAIWACPTAKTEGYSTMGGVIIGNLLDTSASESVYKPSGHEVRFEGKDTEIKSILTDNDPSYHRMTLFERSYLGEKINWYADEPGNLYKPGDKPVEKEYYSDRDTSFGVYGELENPKAGMKSTSRMPF